MTRSALLKAAQHLDGFRWEASLRTWLHRIATDECRQVVAALAALPDRYRSAVLLMDGLGLPAEGVASAMGMSVPAARSVLHRARMALRANLGHPGT